MTINPCVVIPCYNHGYALARLLSELEQHRLPIVVVNDGSTDETKGILEVLCAECSRLTALHRSCNGGKGAALRDGLAWAAEQGYSHALLLDSDGQHSTKDVPRFLESAQRSPDAIILGRPHFGEEAPLVRRIGREISNIFVAVVTAKLAARDVLCGFRVYPLGALEQVPTAQLQPRMGFDAEIVVRALWAGIPVVNVSTDVSYPADGVSHFKYGADNLQLARLYTKLFFEGLYRVPLRWVKGLASSRDERRHWFQITERGSLRGLRALLLVLEKVGRTPLLILLGPVVLHMFVWGRVARRAAVDFQRHVTQLQGRSISLVSIYGRAFRQFWEFGVSIVDKVVSWREGIPLEQFTWEGRDEVKALLAQGQGVIFLGAHVGNIEVIRAFGETRRVVINALMFTGNSPRIRAFLEEINDKSFLRVIDLSAMDPSMVFDLQERLDRGEIVALLGDRATKHSVGRVVEVPFMGRMAQFPEGPWILASLLDAPVYTVFSMRERGNRYRVEFSRLADRISLPRATRKAALQGYISQFASRLEEIVRRYPFQWFNFYPFWTEEERAEELAPCSEQGVAAPGS